jgi:hypothetical protein
MQKLVLVVAIFLAIFLSGCIEKGNAALKNSPQNNSSCGNFNEACCEWFGQDEFGQYTARVYCNDYLECRAGICVEGPDIGTAGRPYS